jgi:hypothetical protein
VEASTSAAERKQLGGGFCVAGALGEVVAVPRVVRRATAAP